jgi:hypothetical protein
MDNEMNLCADQLNQDRMQHLSSTLSDLPQR